MARVLGSTCALVVLLLAVAVAASISNFMGGLKASDLHHAAARIAARASGSYQSPVVPLSGKDDVLALLCGSSTVPERECRDVLRGGAATPPEILKVVGRSATKALAAAVRAAPLLEALHPGLPPNVYAFAKYAHAKIGGGVAAMTSDDAALLEAVDQMRRRGEHLPFAGRAKTTADSYPYFGFLPMALGNALVGGATFTTKTECFRNVSMSAAWTNASQTSVTVTVSAADQISWLCTDTLSAGLFGLGVKFLTFDAAGSKTFAFDFDASTVAPARKWYVASQGVRLDRFNKDILSLILDIIPTVTLIAGFGENPVPNATMQANFEFMRDYVEASPRMQPYSQPRTAGRTVADGLNESYIQSGDALVVVRYDGLDPVIGWGEGYSAGHSVIAVRSPTNGTLYVCESTAHDAYWTRNGIQCHEYREWINLAVQAQYNVLLAPLSPENAAKFNSTAALEFWKETEGLNYGYLNFLFGWIDQKKDNFPCLPPTFDYCLGLGVVETIALAWDEFAADSPENVFRQALNHRLGTTNLSVEEVMMQGAQQGLSFPDIYTRPEQDSWRYNTIKYGQPTVGRAMVCCVFVCHMWKHGGIFDAIGDQINCAEQTLWDIFSMEIFDPAKLGSGRPQICTTTDPNNQLCQLIGTHTFQAKPDFNTRSLYPFMGQNCSSLSPNYVRAPGC